MAIYSYFGVGIDKPLLWLLSYIPSLFTELGFEKLDLLSFFSESYSLQEEENWGGIGREIDLNDDWAASCLALLCRFGVNDSVEFPVRWGELACLDFSKILRQKGYNRYNGMFPSKT